VSEATSAPAELRIDKWLWAARFFKTRSAAATAVSGGKVEVDGEKAKPSRRVRAGMRLAIRRGEIVFQVVVLGVNGQRRPPPRRRCSTRRRRRASPRAPLSRPAAPRPSAGASFASAGRTSASGAS